MPPIPIPILNVYLIHRLWDEENGAQEGTRDVTPIYIYISHAFLLSFAHRWYRIILNWRKKKARGPEPKGPGGQCPRGQMARDRRA
jgi:hypothetical protein